jgi:molybdopterin-binding protein
MSKLIATITNIESVDSLNVVSFDCNGYLLKMMSLELDESVKIGVEVSLGIKSTSIGIAKDSSTLLSYSNQLNVLVQEIDNGLLLSSIKLSFDSYILESIITRDSTKKMDLKIGERVLALIKANDISIVEIIK